MLKFIRLWTLVVCSERRKISSLLKFTNRFALIASLALRLLAKLYQALMAVREADVIVFMVDATEGTIPKQPAES
jgi:hypothetical protein